MADHYKGRGTLNKPISPGKHVKAVLNALIAAPRATLTDIKVAVAKEAPKTGHWVNRSVLERDGYIGRLVKFRVALSPRRNFDDADIPEEVDVDFEREDVAGTCLIHVDAVENPAEHRYDFFQFLDDLPGVIEWDEFSGDDPDYLIRIARKSDGKGVDDILKAIQEHPIVAGARTMHIRRSRIVDNFKPDDFLCFSDD